MNFFYKLPFNARIGVLLVVAMIFLFAFAPALGLIGPSAAARPSPCERAVHHRAPAIGFECCYTTCGDAGVAGYTATPDTHVCLCGENEAP